MISWRTKEAKFAKKNNCLEENGKIFDELWSCVKNETKELNFFKDTMLISIEIFMTDNNCFNCSMYSYTNHLKQLKLEHKTKKNGRTNNDDELSEYFFTKK